MGCGKLEIRNIPAPGLQKATQLCIIDDPATRDGFKHALALWAEDQGMDYKVLHAANKPNVCEWSVKYKGYWKWDLALFLADAEITAYHTGRPAGQVKFLAGQWDTNKFESGDQRIYKLMDMLSGKIDKYPTSRKNRKELGE